MKQTKRIKLSYLGFFSCNNENKILCSTTVSQQSEIDVFNSSV